MSDQTPPLVSRSIHHAARVTVAFSLVYTSTLVLQIVVKKTLLRKARKENKAFHRYSSANMRNADRLVTNLMEWSPVFLAPLWSLAMTDRLGGSTVTAAWAYVACRGAYVVLQVKHGVAEDGNNVPLWASTFPAYGCLLYLLGKSVPLLWDVS
uniref:Uncharacterized protein n=1 Tax=Odontella aurita TaxID=265563 RepID=A0A7S4KCQ9_9STRA|mmetsp:Transcript_9572/g.28721  ORF Transcript_9572/g.28721 Transcript_9572/m.28721 type:complete len:153 (+) Transcript_9572:186-644(+)